MIRNFYRRLRVRHWIVIVFRIAPDPSRTALTGFHACFLERYADARLTTLHIEEAKVPQWPLNCVWCESIRKQWLQKHDATHGSG